MALRPSFKEQQVAIIQSFLRHHWEESGRDGVVLGMSGGLDSSVVAKLSADAIGPTRVLGLTMPLTAEDSQDERDAEAWAGRLGIDFRKVEIGPMVESVTRHLGIPADDRIATGNVHARVRMIGLYQAARTENRLVLGTGNKSELLTGYFCYDEETRAVTPRGLLPHWELRPGDTVFSMDLKTRRVVEAPVEGVHVFPYDGELVRIVHERIDLLVTPNHRLLVARHHGRGPLGFATAEGRFEGGTTFVPTTKPWDGIRPAPAVIETGTLLGSPPPAPNADPPVKMAREDFLYLMGLFVGDGHDHVGPITVPPRSSLTREERGQFRDGPARFAPGPSGLGHAGTYDGRRIRIGARGGTRVRDPLLRLLDRYGIPSTQTPTRVTLANRALAAALAPCGLGTRNRQIPDWVMKLPGDQLWPLFGGLMARDGRSDGCVYTTPSPRLAHQMVELCAKLGLPSRILWRAPRTTIHAGTETPSRGGFAVRIGQRSNTLTFRPGHMSRVSYRGKVWCPSVPPHENLLVERRGRTLFCGNTKFGDGGADFLPIGDVYKTQVRQMARHLELPPAVAKKVPSAGLWVGQTDEEELGLSYDDLDRVLLGLELEMPPAEIRSRTGLPEETVERVVEMIRRSIHKRKMPLIPKVGIRTVGLDWRE
ncbi:MAG: NAD(+) synthase [Thermoplasmata archaeon]